ncbi:MAG TPA: nucleoside deaminase [Clostridia bacterium]|nr:nucleoside deaminase [Clostridia bacterium]
MAVALDAARLSASRGEVPVGAVIVKGNEIVSVKGNAREETNDPTAHAEILAIREAAERLSSWRLLGTILYVTLEPCPMCAGAIIQARIPLLVFGARDPKAGACGSVVNLLPADGDRLFGHKVNVIEGIMEEECRALLSTFFEERRAQR